MEYFCAEIYITPVKAKTLIFAFLKPENGGFKTIPIRAIWALLFLCCLP